MEVIEIRQIKWFGHLRVYRMFDARIQKMVYEWGLEGRKIKGRQPISWKQNIYDFDES